MTTINYRDHLEHLSTYSHISSLPEEILKLKETSPIFTTGDPNIKSASIKQGQKEYLKKRQKKWTRKENSVFLDIIIDHGNDLPRMQREIPTRTTGQLIERENFFFSRIKSNLHFFQITKGKTIENRHEEIKRVLLALYVKHVKYNINVSLDILNDLLKVIQLFVEVTEAEIHALITKSKTIEEDEVNNVSDSSRCEPVILITDSDRTISDIESDEEIQKEQLDPKNMRSYQSKPIIKEVPASLPITANSFIQKKRKRETKSLFPTSIVSSNKKIITKKECHEDINLKQASNNKEHNSKDFSLPSTSRVSFCTSKKDSNSESSTKKAFQESFDNVNNIKSIKSSVKLKENPLTNDEPTNGDLFHITFEDQILLSNIGNEDVDDYLCGNSFINLNFDF